VRRRLRTAGTLPRCAHGSCAHVIGCSSPLLFQAARCGHLDDRRASELAAAELIDRHGGAHRGGERDGELVVRALVPKTRRAQTQPGKRDARGAVAPTVHEPLGPIGRAKIRPVAARGHEVRTFVGQPALGCGQKPVGARCTVQPRQRG